MFGAFSTVPSFRCTANMQNMHVNCKRIYPWPIKHIIICRKKCNIVFSICRICRYSPKKHAHDQQKTTWSLKLTEYAEKMQYRHPPIQEHLVYSHLICMYMYIYVIYTAHVYVCIMPFSEVTVLFNQHWIAVGKFRRAF